MWLPRVFFLALPKKFQSTHPRRVWPEYQKLINERTEFQSTHPRRVWLLIVFKLSSWQDVSIHTPTKGVTTYHCWLSLWLWSFNPHTHEGCDKHCRYYHNSKAGFNPHTHEGCDRISKRVRLSLPGFNPHTHEGCDVTSSFVLVLLMLFQSTHPRRVWLKNSFRQAVIPMFQSTHPRRVWR